jgi:OOP family OmpA-OmpF porin
MRCKHLEIILGGYVFMKNRLGLIFLLSALAACSSTPPVKDFSATADPAQEIKRAEAEIQDADKRQIGVLSPQNFASASDSLDKAKDYLSHNKDQKTVLHEVAVSEAYLSKANETAEVASKIMPRVVKVREDALQAEAPKYSPQELTAADNALKDVTKDIESNDTSSAESAKDKLFARYSDIELQSIRKAKMGGARDEQSEAEKEGARKIAPSTWAWADKKISADDATIVNDRHNTGAVDAASTDAKSAADRLLKITRLAKNSASENPEQLAAKLEQDQLSQEKTEQKLDQTSTELDSKEAAASALAAQNKQLEGQTDLDRKYVAARQQFSDNEAEVYKQGNKLLLRLKGLSFPKDQAIITTNNYPLLAKVQKVIKDVGASDIVIEGHTDSTGSKAVNKKLSAERADAVEGYLVANNSGEKDKISTKGFGDSRPIASNKTPIGRAQNRRVDVIITPQTVQE